MKKLLLIGLFLVTFHAPTVFAIKITNLYHADLPVSSQSDDERAQSVKLGFSQLLIKLTGNPEIGKNPVINEAIQRADYYVQEFSYSLPTTNSATYLIHITFEQDDVKRLLRKAGIAFWGEKRPLVLVWLAMTNSQHIVEIVGNETPGNVIDTMKYYGKRLALPLIFPLMDVTDMGQVSPEEVTTMSLSILRKAGKRYSPNAYLIGRIEPKDSEYQSEWQLILDQDEWSWSITDKTIDAILAEVVSQTSQALAKYYRYEVNS